jgi:hypothetical protein
LHFVVVCVHWTSMPGRMQLWLVERSLTLTGSLKILIHQAAHNAMFICKLQ